MSYAADIETINDLRDSGASPELAEAIVKAVQANETDLATKSDLQVLKNELLAELAKRDKQLIIALIGAIGVATAVLGVVMSLSL